MPSASVDSWNLDIGPIKCHAWNADRTQLAASTSTSNGIFIFEWRNSGWVNVHTLTEHILPITGIDWAIKTNRIVSCSQDKTAFVWIYNSEKGVWTPELVQMQLERAATCVKWSPLENKFAVGSASKLISICYYEKKNYWWVSKQIKKPISSVITSIEWHPNNILIAVGACDFHARVFSTYVNEVDDAIIAYMPWGNTFPFSQLIGEYECAAWTSSVAFSPSGDRIAWVAHDSTISIVDAVEDIEQEITFTTDYLPFTSLLWINEKIIAVAGHDCIPVLFDVSNGQLEEVCKLDHSSVQKSPAVNSALQMFKNIDRMGDYEPANSRLMTVHQNMICQVLPHTRNAQNVLKITTCGVDGLIALWDLTNNSAIADK